MIPSADHYLVRIITPSLLLAALFACGSGVAWAQSTFGQQPEALIEGEVMAIAYSGFREGQHPDRGDGAVNPSRAEILEDLQILVPRGFQA